MKTRNHTLIGLPLAFLLGCGPGSPRQPVTRPASISPAPPSATAAPAAAQGESEPSAAPPAAPAAPAFHLVNEIGDPRISLFRLGDSVLAAGGAIFARLGDAGVEQDALFGQGFPEDGWVPVNGLAGSVSGEMWATVIQSNGRTGWGELYRKGKRGWTRVGGALPQTHVYVGIGNLGGGRVLALSGTDMAFGTKPYFKFQLVSGPPMALPRLTAAKPAPDAAEGDQCRHFGLLQVPKQLAVLPGGDVFVVGHACDNGSTLVEHFRPNQTKSEVYVFPDSASWWSWKLVARSERDLALFAEGRDGLTLSRYDGNAWHTERLDFTTRFVDADRAQDGTLLLVTTPPAADTRNDTPGRLWWRPPGQARFSELFVAKPTPREGWAAPFHGVSAAVATSRDDIWAVSGGSLYRTRPAPGGPIKLASSAGGQRVASLTLPRAATPACEDVYVLLYGITKNTPPNYDFPLTRKALIGRAEFRDVKLAETEENGRRFFGAFVKDYEQGNRLAALVRDSVPGAIPAVLCAKPKVVREVAVEPAAGAP